MAFNVGLSFKSNPTPESSIPPGSPQKLDPDSLISSITVIPPYSLPPTNTAPIAAAPLQSEIATTIKTAVIAQQLVTGQVSISEGCSIPKTRDSNPSLAYGNKHANLVKLSHMVKGIKDVEVPLPFGLPETHVENFLRIKTPELFSAWEELKSNFRKCSDPSSFWKTEETRLALETIQQTIEKAFSASDAANCFPEHAPLSNWLNDLQKNNHYLMVRSTGSEDAEVANAGGNLSLSYVIPEETAVFQAIGKVIASYFSASSLENRMRAGENLLTAPLRLAVTMQRLIGEQIGGEQNPYDIPVSMVLFTNEPYYVGQNQNAAFRIMRMSAGLGHGEGVVKNHGMATDTILVLQSRINPEEIYYLYDNQTKMQRLAPVATADGVKLQPQDNPDLSRERTVLSPQMIRRLFDLGVVIEAKFAEEHGGSAKPIDMELVVKGDIIYPVQARPIHRKISAPTYVDTTLLPPESFVQSIKADKVLVAGTSSVISILKSEDILMATTLEEAEKKFKNEKLVIVQQDEPPLSHPVVNFSGLGIPCFFIKQPTQVQALISQISASKTLLVCLQEGAIYPGNFISGALPIKEGYTSHPASISISMDNVDRQPLMAKRQAQDVIPADLKELLVAVRAIQTRDVAIKALAQHPLIQAAQMKGEILRERISQLTQASEEIETIGKAVTQLGQKITRSLAELQIAHEQKRHELEILFHVKVLQQLLSQDESGVAHLSVASLPKFLSAAETAIAHPTLAKEMAMTDDTVNPRTHIAWQSFLASLEQLNNQNPPAVSKQEMDDFKQLMTSLNYVGAVSLFVNNFFTALQRQDPKSVLVQLLQLKIASELLAEIVDVENSLQSLERDVELFQSPATFEGANKRLLALVSRFKEGFPEKFQSSKSAQLIYIPLMMRIVTLFDSSIKYMKSSPEFSSGVKEDLLRAMLNDYVSLFEIWAEQLVDNWKLHHEDPSAESYMRCLRSWLYFAQGLEPSREFSVGAAVLGSGTTLARHEPHTLEDCFTLIHQNLLNVIARVNTRLLPAGFIYFLDLPPAFLKAMQLLSEGSGGQLIHLQIDGSITRAQYNISLQNHSAAITLCNHAGQEQGQDILSVKVEFYGKQKGWFNRWDRSLIYLSLCEAMEMLTIKGFPYVSDQMLSIEVEQNLALFEDIIKELQFLLRFSTKASTSYCYGDIEGQIYINFIKGFPLSYLTDICQRFHSLTLQKSPIQMTSINMYFSFLNKLFQIIHHSKSKDENMIKALSASLSTLITEVDLADKKAVDEITYEISLAQGAVFVNYLCEWNLLDCVNQLEQASRRIPDIYAAILAQKQEFEDEKTA